MPEFLEEMTSEFLDKVKKGEAKIYNNKNMTGSGFRFDEYETNKATVSYLEKIYYFENF